MNEIERAIAEFENRILLQQKLMGAAKNPLDLCGRQSQLACDETALTALLEQAERQNNPGEVSDGYHTFNELYHHRAVLFSVICNANPEKAWKSKLHHDGTMYNGMFIVGIETPNGQATYHYDTDPYWGMFRVAELPKAPEWDGHTPKQAIERIAGLDKQAARSKGCEVCNGSLPCDNGCDGFCDICDVPEVWKTIHKTGQYNYCPMCGRKLREDNNEAD